MPGHEINIEAIPAFEDNYIWLLTRTGSSSCAVVDPGDHAPVQKTLQAHDLHLDTILITHKHGDHIGGVAKLKKSWPAVKVYGPGHWSIRTITHPVQQDDQVELSSLGITFDILDVPGHTAEHIAYYAPSILFCGDTLFGAGCGRIFNGTPEQFSQSLQKLAALPNDTQVYCAHEYTQANLGFAQLIEPANTALSDRIVLVKQQRSRGESTVPSILADELATNPFMRTEQPNVIAAAEHWAGKKLTNRDQVFRALRSWKDKGI